MAQSIVTIAAEQWLADKLTSNAPARPDRMIFAYIPDQDPNTPIDRSEGLPSPEHIQYTADITQYGLLNENAVIYSVVLDSTIGDWSYNWIGLLDSQNDTVVMIVHTHTQDKLKTHNGVQGNTLTRNLVMQFSGAANAAQVTVTAETWQIDYSARLMGIDERLRIENVDTYGFGAFFGDGFLVSRDAGMYQVARGAGYVHGLRCEQAENTTIATGALPTKVWVDASLQGAVTSHWEVITKLTCSPELSHYTKDSFNHFVFAIAGIAADGTVTDLRPKGPTQQLDDKLIQHEKSRNHPDGTLSAKGFVQLNSAVNSTSETQAATLKAVKIAMDNANARLAKDRNGADIPIPALFVDNLGLRETVNKAASALQNGSYGIGANGVGMTDSDILSPTSRGNTFFNQGGGVTNCHFGNYGTGIHLSYGSSGDNSQRMTANLFVDAAGNLSVEWLAVIKNTGAIARQCIQKLYGPLNKPTAADVRAIPFFGQIAAGKNLNTLTDYGVWFNPANANATLALNYPSTQAGSLQILQDAGTTQIYTEYAGGRQYRRGLHSGTWSAWRVAYDSYNKPTSDDANAIARDTCHVAGFVNGYKEAPYMRHTASNDVIRLLTISAADARYTPLNYAYSKAESDARYIQGVRLGAAINIGRGGDAPAGHLLSGVDGGESVDWVHARPLQHNINGTWYNVTSL